jgi:hypothetical protein
MTPDQLEKFAAIRRLLDEAYKDYFARSDGYCKSSEGYIEVYYPTWFEVEAGRDPMKANGLMVWSYALGPSRQHHFWEGKGRGDYSTHYSADPFAKAVQVVTKWRDERLAAEPGE